jgi:hypothetical protein
VSKEKENHINVFQLFKIELKNRQNKKTCQAVAFTTVRYDLCKFHSMSVAIVWCKGAVKLTALQYNVMCMFYIEE